MENVFHQSRKGTSFTLQSGETVVMYTDFVEPNGSSVSIGVYAGSIPYGLNRYLIAGRFNSDGSALNTRRIVCYRDGGDAIPLREVYAPEISYDESRNILYMSFWTNFASDPGGTYAPGNLHTLLTSPEGAFSTGSGADSYWKTDVPPGTYRALCQVSGGFVQLEVSGGEVGGSADPGYDFVPLFDSAPIVISSQKYDTFPPPSTIDDVFYHVRNISGEVIPAYSAVECTGVDADRIYDVVKPTGNGLSQVFITGASPIPADAIGIASAKYPLKVKYDTENKPAIGDKIGTVADSFEMAKGKKGFVVYAVDSGEGLCHVRPFRITGWTQALSGPENPVKGKFVASMGDGMAIVMNERGDLMRTHDYGYSWQRLANIDGQVRSDIDDEWHGVWEDYLDDEDGLEWCTLNLGCQPVDLRREVVEEGGLKFTRERQCLQAAYYPNSKIPTGSYPEVGFQLIAPKPELAGVLSGGDPGVSSSVSTVEYEYPLLVAYGNNIYDGGIWIASDLWYTPELWKVGGEFNNYVDHFASERPGAVIYMSEDGGETWGVYGFEFSQCEIEIREYSETDWRGYRPRIVWMTTGTDGCVYFGARTHNRSVEREEGDGHFGLAKLGVFRIQPDKTIEELYTYWPTYEDHKVLWLWQGRGSSGYVDAFGMRILQFGFKPAGTLLAPGDPEESKCIRNPSLYTEPPEEPTTFQRQVEFCAVYVYSGASEDLGKVVKLRLFFEGDMAEYDVPSSKHDKYTGWNDIEYQKCFPTLIELQAGKYYVKFYFSRFWTSRVGTDVDVPDMPGHKYKWVMSGGAIVDGSDITQIKHVEQEFNYPYEWPAEVGYNWHRSILESSEIEGGTWTPYNTTFLSFRDMRDLYTRLQNIPMGEYRDMVIGRTTKGYYLDSVDIEHREILDAEDEVIDEYWIHEAVIKPNDIIWDFDGDTASVPWTAGSVSTYKTLDGGLEIRISEYPRSATVTLYLTTGTAQSLAFYAQFSPIQTRYMLDLASPNDILRFYSKKGYQTRIDTFYGGIIDDEVFCLNCDTSPAKRRWWIHNVESDTDVVLEDEQVDEFIPDEDLYHAYHYRPALIDDGSGPVKAIVNYTSNHPTGDSPHWYDYWESTIWDATHPPRNFWIYDGATMERLEFSGENHAALQSQSYQADPENFYFYYWAWHGSYTPGVYSGDYSDAQEFAEGAPFVFGRYSQWTNAEETDFVGVDPVWTEDGEEWAYSEWEDEQYLIDYHADHPEEIGDAPVYFTDIAYLGDGVCLAAVARSADILIHEASGT